MTAYYADLVSALSDRLDRGSQLSEDDWSG